MEKLNVFDFVKTDSCLTAVQSEDLFFTLASLLHDGEKVELSFHDITFVAAAFAYAAIGRLYLCFDVSIVDENLKVVDVSENIVITIEMMKEACRQSVTAAPIAKSSSVVYETSDRVTTFDYEVVKALENRTLQNQDTIIRIQR